MTAAKKGVLTAGALHGLLLALWMSYELAGNIYRENLRLDFTLTSGKKGVSHWTSQEATDENDQSEAIIDEAPSNAPSNQSSGQSGSGDSSGTPDAKYAGENLSSISGLIHRKIYYPRVARQNNWQGRVLVRFVVSPEGKPYDVSLHESSGYSALDESAVETIRELDGLPRPPVPVALTVPIYFKLR